MKALVHAVLAVSLVIANAGLVSASCSKDDPDGSKVLAARAIADQTCAQMNMGCDSGNHGNYVSCVAHVAKDLVTGGTLPKSCKGAVKKCAAQSTCGKPGAVTCCITTPTGMKCKIKNDATQCTAKNGIAGTCASCCDACSGSGTGPSCPTTTTTVTTSTTTTTAGCTIEAQACGSCGGGSCRPHCGVPGTPLVCRGTVSQGLCASDADCPPGDICTSDSGMCTNCAPGDCICTPPCP